MYYYSSTSCAFKKLEGGVPATRTKRKPTYYSPGAEPLATATTKKTKLKMAPHMVLSNNSNNNDESLLQSSISYFKSNPLLFAIVIFPTLTMGILLVARPTLRPTFLGGPGSGNVTRGDNRNDDTVVQSSPMVSSSLVSPGNEQAYYAEAVIATVGATNNDNINIDDRSSSSDEVMVKMEEEVKEVTKTKNIIGRWREKISLRKRYLLDDGSTSSIITTDEKKEEEVGSITPKHSSTNLEKEEEA
jgi:hypothetical protein